MHGLTALLTCFILIAIMSEFKAEVSSHAGLVRDYNEDASLVNLDKNLFVVADGVGGRAKGDVASKLTCEKINDGYSGGESFVDIIESAHRSVLEKSSQIEGAAGMSTTVVAAFLSDETFRLAWVGDSRAYLWKNKDADFRQISKDHSLVQVLRDKGVISEQEAMQHPNKNIITQAVGVADLENIAVDELEGDFELGDIMMLCSDGLSDMVDETHIRQVLGSDFSLKEKCDHLISAALKGGGKDNVTVLVVESV